MISPYRDLYNWFRVDDQLLLELEETPEEDRPRIFLERFPPEIVKSPYNFFSYIYGGHYPRQTTVAVPSLTLDYIVEHHRRWDPDEVACFLLEVAEDHGHLSGALDWLKAVNMPDMLEWPNANQMIWEMFLDARAPLILELIDHYDWRKLFSQYFRKRVEDLDKRQSPEYYFWYFIAKQFDDGTLTDDPDFRLANGLGAALRDAQEGRHYAAIAGLLAFHDAAPEEFPLDVCRALGRSYLEVGWRDLAFEWITKALDRSPENGELQSLQRQALGSDMEQIGKLRKDLRVDHPLLTDDSLEALTQAEFLFRYYGRMLGDYSILASNFGRALEIQLRQVLLPNLRRWIDRYGKANQSGRRFILAGGRRIYADADEDQFTLGVWAKFFDQPWSLESRRQPGQFYYCLHEIGLQPKEYHRLTVLGRSLTEFAKLRNGAAHETFRKWDKVRQMRSLLAEGDLLRLSQPLSLRER